MEFQILVLDTCSCFDLVFNVSVELGNYLLLIACVVAMLITNTLIVLTL